MIRKILCVIALLASMLYAETVTSPEQLQSLFSNYTSPYSGTIEISCDITGISGISIGALTNLEIVGLDKPGGGKYLLDCSFNMRAGGTLDISKLKISKSFTIANYDDQTTGLMDVIIEDVDFASSFPSGHTPNSSYEGSVIPAFYYCSNLTIKNSTLNGLLLNDGSYATAYFNIYNSRNTTLDGVVIENGSHNYSLSLNYVNGPVSLKDVTVNGGDGIYVAGGSNTPLNIENVTINSNAISGYGLSVNGCDDITIKNSSFNFEYKGQGISLQGVEKAVIDGVTITNCVDKAPFVFNNCSDLSVSNITVNGGAKTISHYDVTDLVYDNINLNGVDGNGMEFMYGENVTIKNSSIGNCAGIGISVGWSSNFTIENCKVGTDPTGSVARPNETGIEFYRTTGAVVNNCVVSGNKSNPASSFSERGHGIVANKMTSNITITNNRIGVGAANQNLGNEKSGIFLSWSSNNYVYKNVLIYNGDGGIVQETPYNQNNTISQNFLMQNDGLKNIDVSGINYPKLAPTIISATSTSVYGTAASSDYVEGDIIEVFRSNSEMKDASVYLGSTTVNADGTWLLENAPIYSGLTYLAATATDKYDASVHYGMTSELSYKELYALNNLTLNAYDAQVSNPSLTNVTIDITNESLIDFDDVVVKHFFYDNSGKDIVLDNYDPRFTAVLNDLGYGFYEISYTFQADLNNNTTNFNNISVGYHYPNWTEMDKSDDDVYTVLYDKNGTIIVGNEPSFSINPIAVINDGSSAITLASGEVLSLTGENSYDGFDGRVVSYSWKVDGAFAGYGVSKELTLEDGVYNIELMIYDNDQLSGTSSVEVTVGEQSGGSNASIAIGPTPTVSGQQIHLYFTVPEDKVNSNIKILYNTAWSTNEIAPSNIVAGENVYSTWSLNSGSCGGNGPFPVKLVIDGEVVAETNLLFTN